MIGYVPQEHFLFSDTIANNISFGMTEDADNQLSIESAAAQAGIHDSILGFPKKYQTELGERGINLSGGQKQRIAIARALIKKPSIVIFDDCLSAVDNETEELKLSSIQKELKNSTKFIISHRISSIKYADRIIVLDDQTIVEMDNHEALLEKNGVYASIYAKQKLTEALDASA